jgi:tRNA-dihydrouridine synthase B
MIFPKLKNKAILAPMFGVTDVAFRALCRKYGASRSFAGFVNSTGLIRKTKQAVELLKTDKSENPVGVQLFGVRDLVEAAKRIEDSFDVIDINLGCPSRNVTKLGAGSALLLNPKKVGKLVGEVVNSVNKPVSVKTRSDNVLRIAKIVEKAGVSVITVHARSQNQGYLGKADWDLIKKVKESVSIPVFGSGDVFSKKDFDDKKGLVDGVMIARGCVGNPYFFKTIQDDSKKSGKVLFKEYLRLAKKHEIPFSQIKKQALSFGKHYGLIF